MICRSALAGWPIGTDGPFAPQSTDCLRGWQALLSARPPALMLAEAQADAASGVTAARGGEEGGRVFVASTISTEDVHGLAMCTRLSLTLACAAVSDRVCSTGDEGGGSNANAFGGLKSAPQSRARFERLYYGATFALQPGGDTLDRDSATLQTLASGAIPVFFGGNSRGDLIREGFAATLFGGLHPDEWSVLIDAEAAAAQGASRLARILSFRPAEARYSMSQKGGGGCAGCQHQCNDLVGADENATGFAEAVATELFSLLGRIPAGRLAAMRAAIVRTLPMRVSRSELGGRAARRAEPDLPDRLVSAMLTARPVARSGEAAAANSPLSWPPNDAGPQDYSS